MQGAVSFLLKFKTLVVDNTVYEIGNLWYNFIKEIFIVEKQKHKAVIEKIFAYFGVAIFAAILFGAAIYWLPYLPVRKSENALASSDDNMSGWAWSSTLGWVSFNSTNCDSDEDGIADSGSYACEEGKAVASYGVNLNLNSGEIEDGSFAWSSGAGWINFNPVDAPPAVLSGDDYNYPVRLDVASGQLRGWAKIISISGDSGWVRFHSDPDDPVQYGVNLADGEDKCTIDNKIQLEGYAWCGGFGWISFKGDTDDGNRFGVYAKGVPELPEEIKVAASASSGCSSIMIAWEYSGIGQVGFEVQKKGETGWPPESELICKVGSETRSCFDTGLEPPGGKYFYRVRAVGECENSDWVASGQALTSSICAISSVSAKGQCPESVIVSWSAPAAASGADLSYVIERKETKDEDGNPVAGEWAASSNGTCSVNPAPPSCIDALSSSGAKKTYIYKVTAIDSVTEDRAETESNEVVPCPPAPSWIEVNPR